MNRKKDKHFQQFGDKKPTFKSLGTKNEIHVNFRDKNNILAKRIIIKGAFD